MVVFHLVKKVLLCHTIKTFCKNQIDPSGVFNLVFVHFPKSAHTYTYIDNVWSFKTSIEKLAFPTMLHEHFLVICTEKNINAGQDETQVRNIKEIAQTVQNAAV